MALFSHTQKSFVSTVFLFVALTFAIVAYNVFWTNISATNGNTRIFLTDAQDCTNDAPCTNVCYVCLCGATDVGNSTVAMLALGVAFLVISWITTFRRDIYDSSDWWSRFSVIFMALSSLFFMLAPVVWGTTCHENVLSLFVDTSTEIEFGAGFILASCCAVITFVQAIYYGRLTGVCGGGAGMKADPSIT